MHIPPRPIGEPLQFDGMYLMRIKGSLESMTPERIKKIMNEAEKDYSSTFVKGAKLSDLAPEAIKELRRLLSQSKRVNKNIKQFSDKQLLTDLGLINHNKITIAALVLLGKEKSLKTYLPCAEVRFGYKSSDDEIKNQDTAIYSNGFLLFYNELFEKINLRNLTLSVTIRMQNIEKKAFDDRSIREAINNAIMHRDYSEHETIIIIQTQNKLTISSPGGLLEGITNDIESMMNQTKTRNKLIADTLYKCDFVEQFGNGVDLMIENQLNFGKKLPDYKNTDRYHVVLELDGRIQDAEFAKYVILAAATKGKELSYKELLALHKIKNSEKIESGQVTQKLLSLGLIESKGRNKYILSKDYYQKVGRPGEYTRKVGLDKEANKTLILQHLKHHKKGYMRDFIEALNNTPRSTIGYYLNELKTEGKIKLVGNSKIVRGKNVAFWTLK